MRRYIDADKLQKDGWKLRREKHGLVTSTYETMELDCVPTADVRENVRGEWIPVTNGRGGFECSKCHDYAPSYQNGDDYLSHFCPNCGADMRGQKNEI